MKRAIITLILILSCLVVQAEHSYTLSKPLDGKLSYHYTANSHITLEKGFQAEPQNGHEVVLDIDPFDISAIEGGITGGTLANNNNGVVGSLGGVVDVSLLGGAVYSIPIDLPDGLGSIQPQLSICYNSQDRNGLLGWGWNLGGLSSISRTGSTPYHDGNIGICDRFCLDGNRLLKTGTGNYGGNGVSYRTEQDLMSKIVSFQESGITGPSYFKVWTADGRIMYYGHSSDSKAFVDPMKRVNLWLLNRVEDRDGNYMEFHYTIDKDHYRLDEIVYSGNANDNISPELRVAFNYTTREDVDIAYLGNCIYRKKQLLDRITIFNRNNELFSYTFSYQSPNPQTGYYYNLLTKIRLNAGDEHFNPTLVKYGSNNYSATSGSELKYHITTNGNPNGFFSAVKFSGDFNGDGFDDVVAVQPNSNGQYDQAQVFVNKGVSSGNLVFDLVRSFDLNSNISWIQVVDLNGDGLDDLIFSNRHRGTLFFPDHVETEIYLSHNLPSGGFEFIRKYTPICSIPQDLVETHLVGDFFGEGMNSILVQTVSEEQNGIEASLLYRYDEATGEFLIHEIPEHLSATRFFPADYNGDGITEILYQKENGTTAMAQLVPSGNTYHYNEIYCGNPSNWEDAFPGDYNGDGLIDILFYTDNATQKWVIYLSTPRGFGDKFPLPQNFPYSSPGDYLFSLDRPHHTTHYLKAGDFDGNGCSDLALFKDGQFHVFYGPIRANGTNAPFANIQQISETAFNSYDNMSVCLGNFLGQERLSYLGTTTLSRLPSAALRLEARSIIDGLGRKTEFTYDYLMPNPNNPSEDDFYHVNSYFANHDRHVHSSAIPLRALKKLTTYNVSNKPVTTQCFYEGGLIHNQGRGFLGFTKTRQDDYCNGQLQKKTVRQYEIDYTYSVIHMNLMEENVYDQDGALMARSTYLPRIYSHIKNDKVFIPISNKSIEEFDVDHPGRLLKKEIYETEVATHCSQTNRYDEVLSVISQAKGATTHQDYTIARICEFQETNTTTYLNDNLSTWLINRPSSTCNIAHREGNYADLYHLKQFTYDAKKPYRIISILDLPNDGSYPDDPLALITEYDYDRTGNVTTQTVSTPNDKNEPRCEVFEYDKTYGRRLLTKRTDALNQVYTYTYDPVYNYCTSATDCNGMTTEYSQDPMGITVNINHPDGTRTCKALRWGNESYFQWEKRTGQETKWNYFAPTGEALQTKSYDLNGEMLLCEYKYDEFGRVIKKWEPHGLSGTNNYYKYEYDTHHQLCRIYHPDGSKEEINHDGNASSTVYYAPDGSTQSNSKTTNIMGWVVRSTDAEGNSIIYDYRADGKPLWSQLEGYVETRIEMDYDALGNQSLLSDPDYGTVTYEYNAFNELTRQVSPKQDEINFFYDPLGRITRRIETDRKSNTQEVTQWTYGSGNGQKGLLTEISSPNQIIQYLYDPLLRLSGINEIVLGEEYPTIYTYDQASRVISTTYPSKYRVNYHYTSEGFLKSITDNDSNDLWRMLESNEMMQPTRIALGNGVVSKYEYDKSTHRLTSILSVRDNEVLQDLSYQYDHYSNMTRRDDYKNKSSERFAYDKLNRLTDVVDAEGHSGFHYDPLGRMTEKSTATGAVFYNADYSGPQPHAIKSVQSPHGVFPQERIDLAYNVFDKVESINEGTNSISFEYGYDHHRIKMSEKVDGVIRNKTYVNNCEFVTSSKGDPATWTFLSGPTGVFAVVETINNIPTLHYILKDHLGSWVAITDNNGQMEQKNHFDAWGLCPRADDLMFDRGYTGHEHIKGTGLINMNGRLYDPLTSSMISPDNNIQMPDFTQNFNRYSYCLNNPLTYTDPDGNSFVESALIFYIIYCTDFGYEFQKYTQALAVHIDLHLSSQQIGLGVDFSFGVPKKYGISYRTHLGATYYCRFYDKSYNGFEFRLGGEWCAASSIGYSGTTFYQGKGKQTTNSIILGTYWCSFAYENDYMFNLGKYIPCVPAADGGDRYRSAAARFRLGVFSMGVNLFTGDPGVDHDIRRTFEDPDANGRETYTISANGDNPDEYRAGVFYVGFGPFKVGANSEQIRNIFQNRFAHDFLCRGDSPYFKVLDRPGHAYFYFGTETGNSLW